MTPERYLRHVFQDTINQLIVPAEEWNTYGRYHLRVITEISDALEIL